MIRVVTLTFLSGFASALRRVGSSSGVIVLATIALWSPLGASVQDMDVLVVRGPDDSSISVPIRASNGFATFSHEALGTLGWVVDWNPPSLRARLGSQGPIVEFSADTPFFLWNEELLQLVNAPFVSRGSVEIPLQFLLDFLPARASDAFAFSSDDGVLEVLDASLWRSDGTGGRRAQVVRGQIETRSGPVVSSNEPSLVESPPPSLISEDPEEAIEEALDAGKRVVVIDPGHGGRDPGTTGAGGRREKDIALAIGRYLERELGANEDFEVHMTRDRDVLVPLWERGPQATELKGERPGLFISIHVNSAPSSPGIRGFETYFLSEARTDDERRVAAIENAPLELQAGLDGDDIQDSDLTSILQELRNLDHQHWSSLLAEGIQGRLEAVHPGPNRGVKQGPFAVITNALMPAVLVELGFISNREEERVLSSAEFQRGVAVALGQAIRDFFDRYPPEQGVAAQGLSR